MFRRFMLNTINAGNAKCIVTNTRKIVPTCSYSKLIRNLDMMHLENHNTLHINSLPKRFTHSDILHNDVKSFRQILGLDTTTLALPEIKKTGGNLGKFTGCSGGGQWGDYLFSYNYTRDKAKIKMTHAKKEGFFEAFSAPLKDDLLNVFNKTTKDLSPIKFIHDWYDIKVSHDQRILYCPKLKIIISETCQLEVPEKLLDIRMSDIQFYKERLFVTFLAEKGCPIDRFRSLPGISNEKLNLLSDHQYVMGELITKGIKIEEFANIDESRLAYVMTHYSELRGALEFVPISQILNLPSTAVISSEESMATVRMR